MVSVFFGKDFDAVKSPSVLFNHTFLSEWLDDPFVKEMIEDIDGSKVLSPYCIQSPVLGQIPPERLSGGVKVCICLWKLPSDDEVLFDLKACGENCQPWLAEIFKRRDVRVTMCSYDLTFEGLSIEGVCENDNSKILNAHDWTMKMLEFAGEARRNEGSL